MELRSEIPDDLQEFDMVVPNPSLLGYVLTVTEGWPNAVWGLSEVTPNYSFW